MENDKYSDKYVCATKGGSVIKQGQIKEYELVGLEDLGEERGMLAILKLSQDGDGTFSAQIRHTRDRQMALMKYCKGDWDNRKLATIVFVDFDGRSIPRYPVMTHFRHVDEIQP